MLQARWQTASACNNNAWIMLRPLCPPIPCMDNNAPHVRPYVPPYMQRVTQSRNAYKRAALLLLVLPIRIDSRRNTPTLHALSSVPYRPRIQTPCKNNQRATHTQQLFAPSTGQALHLTIPPAIQRHKASRNHCRQFRQPGQLRPASPQRIAQTINDRQPAEHKAARLAAALATIRPPGPYQPPQFAPTGQRFPLSAGYLRTIPATRAGILARLLAYLCTNECIFAYSQ